MTRKKMRKNTGHGNEDQVLRIAIIGVIVLFLIGAVIVGTRLLNPKPETAEGVRKLNEMDKLDVSEVESEIDALEASEQQTRDERSKRPNEEKFEDALIIGDFIAQGLYEQDVLDESFVLAEAESCVHDPDGTGVTDGVRAVIQAQPEVLFLELGINDTIVEGASEDTFESDYKAVLEQLKSQLPDTKIYVNSILPVADQALNEHAGYSNAAAYNRILKALCKQEKVVFIDSTGLVQPEYYKGDGRHMTKDYFTLWAAYMADVAKL